MGKGWGRAWDLATLKRRIRGGVVREEERWVGWSGWREERGQDLVFERRRLVVDIYVMFDTTLTRPNRRPLTPTR